MKHCWHEKHVYGHSGEQCCHCGIRWWPEMGIPIQGHGPFAPKTQDLPKPNKECAGAPLSKGKGGRSAILDDVDFAQVTS
jgi:hypothetical protein